MTLTLRNSAIALALIGTAAIAATPALALHLRDRDRTIIYSQSCWRCRGRIHRGSGVHAGDRRGPGREQRISARGVIAEIIRSATA
jgi:hypothetical protein